MKNIFIGLLLLALALPGYGGQSSGGGTTLNGQPSSYYLSRANHTGTQADSTLDTITTAGKVSGNTITSGTIAGTTAINTTGGIKTTNTATVGATAFFGTTGLASIDSTGNLKTSGGVETTSILAGGAEKLKVWTYTHAITAGEAAADSCSITVTAVTLLKVRSLTAAGKVAVGTLVYGSGNSLAGNYWMQPVLTTTTNCDIGFGINWVETDTISITIIEAQ